MARPIYQTITATGNTTPLVVDYLQTPFGITAAVEEGAGVSAISVTLQYTLDDPNDASWTPVWFSAGAAVTANTVWTFGPNAGGANSYPGPIRALRLNVATLTGGNLRLAVLQGVSPYGG